MTERAILRFPNAIVIPIGQLARRQNELNIDQDTVFVCKEGKAILWKGQDHML